MPEEIVARILRLAGYGVYAWDADEGANTLTLSIRQTGRAPADIGSGWGISRPEIHSWTERRIRDLPWGTWQVWLRVEVHRVRCRQCGVRTERLPFVGGKAHYTTRLEAAVARGCEAAPVSRVAAQWGLPPETVRRLDKRVRRRWAAARPRRPLRYLGVDEIFLGKTVKRLAGQRPRAGPLGVQVSTVLVRNPSELDDAFSTLKNARVGGLIVDLTLQESWRQIVDLALKSRLPTVSGPREFVEAGGLMAYGPDFPDLFRRAASYVDKILKGAKPADLSVEQATKFELVINMKTAQALGLMIPPSLLLRADQVIE